MAIIEYKHENMCADQILLRSAKIGKKNNHILYHELWHFVFFQLLSNEEQQQWYRISRTLILLKYASMSVYEDFAEEFRDYSQKKQRKIIKRSFIKDI